MVVRNITFKSESALKKQLISFFVFGVVLLSLSTSIVTAWQTSKNVREEAIKTGLQIANSFAQQSVVGLLTGSQENAKEAVDTALGFESVDAVAIYGQSNQPLLAVSKKGGSEIEEQLESELQQPILVNEFSEYWVFAAPVLFEEEVDDEAFFEPDEVQRSVQYLGYVLLNYDKSALAQIQRSIFINNILIGALITAVLVGLMSWGINRLMAPLSNLSTTMKNAGDSGDYLFAEVSGAKEIRRIAAVYNQMMSRLAKQRAELEKHRANLESEVEIRTQELKAARDTALTASRHKSEFLANISHELRTPLQAIIGYVDLVREDLMLECLDAQVEDLTKAIRSAHILLGLINNILDIAKIEAGKMDLYIQSVSMHYLVSDTIETVTPMANANDNKLVLEKGELAESLNIDRQKLMQVFLNLLSNACKFTKHGTITFKIENDDKALRFSVEDTGIGIPKDKLSYIFEQFTQVDGSQSRKFEGTGLGMAITQNFCEMMGAEITVESEEGVGTAFRVSIPLQLEGQVLTVSAQ
ncbi:HAMP domain-containing sensor histidine kinase [Aliikangiella sp. G2MR2-5]|uniref:sensor histidine kinase n=1 Tax=Aliikangiella sp. G2MR2-5 TaxID=2788943 RepID=UPI0018ABFAD2|nr:ATP-binding protein [Aliikangiella sp. G2MR2-5]